MTSLKRILYLSAMVAAIGVFWLIPKVNTAKDVRYTRVFENTGQLSDPKNVDGDTLSKASAKSEKVKPVETKKAEVKVVELKPQEQRKQAEKPVEKKTKKEYKKESIEPDLKLKDVKVKMYGRAIHFSPEEEIVVEDTTKVLP